MQWVALILAAGLYLGLRDRIWGGSTHTTLLAVVIACVAAMFFFQL
ncbi:MAG: hypothetical protein J2P45_11105 [Candidatus Dormibacteraeota bacterium]|nr:hypothetical protein [Candidatus Dormibacteraeota bacterium]